MAIEGIQISLGEVSKTAGTIRTLNSNKQYLSSLACGEAAFLYENIVLYKFVTL